MTLSLADQIAGITSLEELRLVVAKIANQMELLGSSQEATGLRHALWLNTRKRLDRERRGKLALSKMQAFRDAGVGADPENLVELAYSTSWRPFPIRIPALKLHDTKPLVLVRIRISEKGYGNYWVNAMRLELIPQTLDFSTMQEGQPLLLSKEGELTRLVSFTSHDPSKDGDLVYVTENVEEGAFPAAKADLFPWVWPLKRKTD